MSSVVAAEVDRQIISGYRLHDSNLIAFQRLEPQADTSTLPAPAPASIVEFDRRLAATPQEHHPWLLAMYANSIRRKLELGIPMESGSC